MSWSFTGERSAAEDYALVLVGVRGQDDVKVVQGLIDTGASHTCVSAAFAARAKLAPTGKTFTVVEASREVVGEVYSAELNFINSNEKPTPYYTIETEVVVIRNMSRELVVGMSTLSNFDLMFRMDRSFTISIP